MKNNTIVTACDTAYAWGVWLLIASARKAGMDEPFLVGTFCWTEQWKDDVAKLGGVAFFDLPPHDKRCITCSKPLIMLEGKTDRITWVDCDGIFSGNCSDVLYGEDNSIYVRLRTPNETRELYHRERPVNDSGDTIPVNILQIWKKDVNERPEPSRLYSCSTGIISIPKNYLPFIDKWKNQIQKVLPSDVGVVNHKSIGYFQTDDSVLNSLLLFSKDAPPITQNYKANDISRSLYIHYAYNPKPWKMWNPYTMRFFDQTLDIIEWGAEQNLLPKEELPYTLKRKNKKLCARLAPLAKQINRIKKIRKMLHL